jgi:hypothetical protein
MLPHLDMGLKDKEVLGLLQLESKRWKQNLSDVRLQTITRSSELKKKTICHI